MSEPLKDQIDALVDLQQHPGWLMYRDAVMKEIASDFEENITKALNVPDGPIALERMRQVAAVRLAGLRWLKWPSEKLTQVRAQAEGQRPDVTSRRPEGV